MRNCSFCKNPLRPGMEWKGSDGRFYCNEFCADAGEDQIVHVPKLPEMTPTLRRTSHALTAQYEPDSTGTGFTLLASCSSLVLTLERISSLKKQEATHKI
jgi:hypothetical protein